MKWDKRFLGLAKTISTWSKDPSTKVGAVIVDKNRRIVSIGFNGYARGVDDAIHERSEKLRRTIHAEENAILFARRDIEGCTIYVTHPPCGTCAAKIIQTGIERVVWLGLDDDMAERWKADIKSAFDQFMKANIKIHVYNEEYLEVE